MVTVSLVDNPYRRADGSRKHDTKSAHGSVTYKPPKGTREWVGVDGEGVTDANGEHRYVLLGVGDEQIDNPMGLGWREIFEFLYDRIRKGRAFVGFYLGYDFTQWLRSIPEDRARRLLTIDGKASRKSNSPNLRGRYLPVDLDGWQIDMLGQKRMQIRPKDCSCLTWSCPHKSAPWLYVCDAGPFFQTSFLNVIEPSKWQHPVVTQAEYDTICEGKARRDVAQLDQDMRRYNVLENEVLSRVMHDLDDGFRKLDIYLSSSQWYGPGQASQQWLKGRAPKRETLSEIVPQEYVDASRASYFGGWFEIMAHGIVPGTSWEYDINSAYPHVISELPCLEHGQYTSGTSNPPGRGYTLVHTTVWTYPPHSGKWSPIGAMLHRDDHGRISRPMVTRGWYWTHELDAGVRAGIVSSMWRKHISKWVSYAPCTCLAPVRKARALYQMRLDVGKKSSLGKSSKLVNNSGYGKFAQSVGVPYFGNPVYASLITAGCRTMILDAIASHPGGKDAVLMVATDGVYFTGRHPSLPVSGLLGDWEESPRESLTLFKPGVYWDDIARAAIAEGSAPAFKARGVNAREFAQSIQSIDDTFRLWNTDGIVWPDVSFRSSFSMVTALQALTRNKWRLAGQIDNDQVFYQSADPSDKRDTDCLYRDDANVWRTMPYEFGPNAHVRTEHNMGEWSEITEVYDSVPYEKRFGMEDPFSDESRSQMGTNGDEEIPMIGAFRLLTGQET